MIGEAPDPLGSWVLLDGPADDRRLATAEGDVRIPRAGSFHNSLGLGGRGSEGR